jgi:hypothetical protein
MAQSVEVRLNRGETSNVKTGRGVRQGCCLSPILFKLYNECLTKEAVEGFGDFKIGRPVERQTTSSSFCRAPVANAPDVL